MEGRSQFRIIYPGPPLLEYALVRGGYGPVVRFLLLCAVVGSLSQSSHPSIHRADGESAAEHSSALFCFLTQSIIWTTTIKVFTVAHILYSCLTFFN